ncbi:MAG: TetR/AcrR family transcriptional regulator [Geodermatophilaceae bacterium]|nr:TetR/AcrR family transcriptional regulator [Geodermatophilaceae bacterium]
MTTTTTEQGAGADRPEGRQGRLPRPARRHQLLQAARDIFVARGYHAAAMDEIADRAGVSKPVLYQHFPGKRELYLALLDEQVKHLEQRVVSALQSTDNNKERVHAAIAAYFAFVDSEGEAFRLLWESDLRNDPEVHDKVERSFASIVSSLADTINSESGAGPAQSKLLSAGLTGLGEIGARWWLERRNDQASDLSRDEAVALMSALAWRGISGFPLQSDLRLGEATGN